MYYYQHNIGDFDKATRHLSRIERSVYRDLIELYYDTETQLNADIPYLCRKILATSEDESTAVKQVLNEFFSLTPDGWYHDRCEEEIEKYKTNMSQKAEAGRRSAAARKEKRQRALNGSSTSEQRNSNVTPTNHKPITKNQEPENNLKDLVDSSEPTAPVKDYLHEEFERFWRNYPTKKAKVSAEKSFLKLVKGKKPGQVKFYVDMILSYHMDCIEREEIGADKLHAATLLNQRRWNDTPDFVEAFKIEWMKENAAE